MSALANLAALLRPASEPDPAAWTPSRAIDAVLAKMEAQHRSHKPGRVPDDLQLEAVRRFWAGQEVRSFRDAYLLSWGLCVPHRTGGECVLDDRDRLERVLAGIDSWSKKPRFYRRCYQGLVRSYFTYDGLHENTSASSRKNWAHLRDYLHGRNPTLDDGGLTPEWVDAAVGNRHLFADNPYEPYVDALLNGDASAIELLCEQLGIAKASWFLRELVLAQVRGAAKLGHAEFQRLMPRLLDLLSRNEVLRDRGLISVLDRYVQVPAGILNQGLRDAAVQWWGNPWLPSNEKRWGGVVPEARAMVADWLKLEFIETFFTKLAEDGLGDPRRMEFWKRYVKAIDHIEFALGPAARNSRERDFVALRKKMTGLVRELDAAGKNNAFIMTMGDLVAVEFSDMGNALYGYDRRQALPFDVRKALTLPKWTPNSLKQRSSAILWLKHGDGIHSWDKWEQMFEERLRKDFGIKPGSAAPSASPYSPTEAASRFDTPSPPVPSRPSLPPQPQPPLQPRPQATVPLRSPFPTAPAAEPLSVPVFSQVRPTERTSDVRRPPPSAAEPFSRAAVDRFAASNGLAVEDKSMHGGNLWVLTERDDPFINSVLLRWGFRRKAGKGWWK